VTHSNALQHTATHCNTLQHTATHCNSQSPLDTPFGAPDSRDIGLSETTLTARLSETTSFTFRARDPNAEDAISIMFLEDPGIPNEAVGKSVCFSVL